MTNYGGISGDQLRQYIGRIEQLEAERKDVAEAVRDAYAEAKVNGFDPKVMRQLIRIRKLNPMERSEQEEVLEIYKHAMGMLVEDEAEAA